MALTKLLTLFHISDLNLGVLDSLTGNADYNGAYLNTRAYGRVPDDVTQEVL